MTPLVKRLLFATDFSDCAARAEDYAVLLAEACGAGLDILHVLEFQTGMDPEYPVNQLYLEQLRKQAAGEIDVAVNRISKKVAKVTARQVLGIPSQCINEIAKETDADLVVLGTRGRTGLEHILLGSTAERVIAGAPCPVLTVRLARGTTLTAARQGAAPAIRRILAPVDFSDCSLESLEYAAHMAAQFGAAITIFHVMEPVSYSLDFTLTHAGETRANRERLESRLTELAAPLKRNGLNADVALRGGVPADSILDQEREQAYDVLVMGTHGRRGVSHLVSGSVAEAVLRRAAGPVLTVKSPKFRAAHRPN
ncbi:MAG: universal stress protein [Nitrospira sp.]|nr:universal stress protein [Nitrospira sp.]